MSAGDPMAHVPPHIHAAFAIPEPSSISEMFAILGANHNEMIEDFEPINKQGCWITPRVSTTAAELEQAITPTLIQGNWIVTSLKEGRVLIEPRYTRLLQVEPRGPVYHVTTRERRESIRQKGLEPRGGGNTRMQRKYPPRTFVALNLVAAFEFVDFQCRRDLPVMRPSKTPNWIDPKLLRNTDIWGVRLPDDARLRHDVLFTGKGDGSNNPSGQITCHSCGTGHWHAVPGIPSASTGGCSLSRQDVTDHDNLGI